MVALNEIFRSNMIFQANKPVRFFGTGSGEVVITFCNITKKISANGQWLLEFSPLPYGGPHTAEVVLDGEKTILKNKNFIKNDDKFYIITSARRWWFK